MRIDFLYPLPSTQSIMNDIGENEVRCASIPSYLSDNQAECMLSFQYSVQIIAKEEQTSKRNVPFTSRTSRFIKCR